MSAGVGGAGGRGGGSVKRKRKGSITWKDNILPRARRDPELQVRVSSGEGSQ